jgi:hypothetical protein
MLPIHIFNNRLILDGDMAGNITSTTQNVQEAVSFSVHGIWTGTSPVGTLDIQGSNDGVNFTSVLSSPAAISGNSGQIMVNVEKHAYAYIRLVYTETSGTGTLNVYVNGKRA